MSAPTAPPGKRRRLGEILLDAGLINQVQLQAALAEQRKWGGKLGRTLVEMGFLDEESMVLALSRQLGFPAVDLDRTITPPHVLQMLRVDVAERLGVFPLGGDPLRKILHIATSDPTNVDASQELSFLTGMRIQVSVAGSSAIDRAIRRHYYGERTTSTATATPESFGVEEPTYDLGPLQAARGAPSAAAPPPPAINAITTQLSAIEKRLDAMSERMVLLEKSSANQVRALRGLLELLIEKGVMTRDEFMGKVRKS